MQRSYSLEELAKFLNRSSKDVKKLVEKEILKGRKVQGNWMFSIADVVSWMEQEMTRGESDQTEQLEDVVASASEEAANEIALSDLLSVESIDTEFAAKTKSSVINEIVKLGERVGKLWDGKAMSEALREREEMTSTALENGAAILHPRRPQPSIIGEDFLALAISYRPIPFGGNRETDVFFLLCCQNDTSYLRTLGKLARTIKTPGFLTALRECPDAAAVHDLIKQTENDLN